MNKTPSPHPNWKTLLHHSQINNSKSKPEVLAIIELLSKKGKLTISDLEESFIECYNNPIPQRKLRTTLNSMVENNLISAKTKDGSSLYYIDESTRSIPTPTPYSQLFLMVFLLTSYFYTLNFNLILILMGTLLSILINLVTYFIATRNGVIYYLKLQNITTHFTKSNTPGTPLKTTQSNPQEKIP